MNTKRALTNRLCFKPVRVNSISSLTKLTKLTNEQNIINRLKSQRRKLRAHLLVESYVDNWPYIKVLPEKLRGRLLHQLRLVNEALVRKNKVQQRNRVKKQRLAK
ncbi:MAG: hypothetical protein FD167_4929 [bacterium]|nr:MAG: hypothetical protein FD167_4929 [bacterium]